VDHQLKEASTMADFYYRSGDHVRGPMTGIDLREAAFAGHVTSVTLIANNPAGPWVAAGSAAGFFDQHGKPLPHPLESMQIVNETPPPADPRHAQDQEVAGAKFFNFTCPSCNHTIEVPSNLAGKQGKCASCATVVLIAPTQAPTSTPPAAGTPPQPQAPAPGPPATATPPLPQSQAPAPGPPATGTPPPPQPQGPPQAPFAGPLPGTPMPMAPAPVSPTPGDPYQPPQAPVAGANPGGGWTDWNQKPTRKKRGPQLSEREQIRNLIKDADLPNYMGEEDAYERMLGVSSKFDVTARYTSTQSRVITLTLCLLFGHVGVHRFYLGSKRIAFMFIFASKVTTICFCLLGPVGFAFLAVLQLAIFLDYMLIVFGIVGSVDGREVPWDGRETGDKSYTGIFCTVTSIIVGIVSICVWPLSVLATHFAICGIGTSRRKLVPILALVLSFAAPMIGLVLVILGMIPSIVEMVDNP